MPTAETPPRTESEELLFELREALGALRRRVAWPIISALAVFGAAAFLVGDAAPAYRSAAQLVVDPRGLQVFSEDLVPRSPFSDVLDAVVDTEIRLITSQQVMERAAADVAGRPEFAGEETTGDLYRAIAVRREASSFVVTIEAVAETPERAAARASAVVDSYLAETQARRRALAERALDALSGSLAEQRERLTRAEAAVAEYRSRNGILDQDGMSLNSELLSDVNRQLVAARDETRVLEARLEGIRRLGSAPEAAAGFDLLDSPVLDEMRGSYAAIASQLEDLEAALGPRHPRIVSTAAQARSLREAIAREAERVADALRSQTDSARERQAALERDLQALQTRTSASNSDLVGLRALEREAQAQRTVYESYLQRERELFQQAAFDVESITVLSAPQLPSTQTGVSPVLILAAATVLGALVGAAVAIVRERLDGRIHSAARMAAVTGLPVLGVLPLGQRRLRRGAVGHALAGGVGSRSARVLYMVRDGLETLFGDDLGVTLVVSLTRGGARDAVPLSLALALADGDRSTLLVPQDETALATAAEKGGLAVEGNERSAIDVIPVGRLATGNALDRALGARERVVVALGPDADDRTLRDFARAASCVILAVEIGASRFVDVEDLRLALGRHADKALGTLVIAPGRDPLAPPAVHRRSVPHLAAA